MELKETSQWSGNAIDFEVSEQVSGNSDLIWSALLASELKPHRLIDDSDWTIYLEPNGIDHDSRRISLKGRGNAHQGFGRLDFDAMLSLSSEVQGNLMKLSVEFRMLGSSPNREEIQGLLEVGLAGFAEEVLSQSQEIVVATPMREVSIPLAPRLIKYLTRKSNEMKIDNSFSIEVPIDQVWTGLLDLERVAGYLPGASIRPADADGEYLGSMKVKVGPVVTAYDGKVKLGEVDDTNHRAVLHIDAQEKRGQGTVSATITNSAMTDGKITTVNVETELTVTGRQAQFGRGIMNSVADKMLGEFAERFEAGLLDGPRPAGPDGDGGPGRDEPDENVMDVGAALFPRPILIGAGVVILVLIAIVLGRGRR